MLQFLYVILLNSAVFLTAFISFRFYDKKSGKNTASGLKMTYAISVAISIFMSNSGLITYGMEKTLPNIILMTLICMFPVSTIVNCGYVIATLLRAIFEKVRGVKPEKSKEETVTVLKSKTKRKK